MPLPDASGSANVGAMSPRRRMAHWIVPWFLTGCDPSMTAYDCSRVSQHVIQVSQAERAAGQTPVELPWNLLRADCAYRLSPRAFTCIEKAATTREMLACTEKFPYRGSPPQ
jgi:hypothetical protein